MEGERFRFAEGDRLFLFAEGERFLFVEGERLFLFVEGDRLFLFAEGDRLFLLDGLRRRLLRLLLLLRVRLRRPLEGLRRLLDGLGRFLDPSREPLRRLLRLRLRLRSPRSRSPFLYGLKPCEKPVASPRMSAPDLEVMALSPSGASFDQPRLFAISARNSSTSLSLFNNFALGPSSLAFTFLTKSFAWSRVAQ